MDNLYIAKKIKVGFQARSDTYTKKLGYVIYYDDKGKLRKETSWEGWRDKKIAAVEYDNIPTEGFVLNKGAGGKAGSWNSWNIRREVVRIWDPRNFEFEISVDNLLFILTECDCTRGKGLSGEFVYAWNGKELMLLPASCEAYKTSSKFTALQAGKVVAKELIIGATYETKRQETYVYLGRFDYYTWGWGSSIKNGKYVQESKKAKKYIFLNNKQVVPLSNVDSLSKVVNSTPIPNYAELVAIFTTSRNSSPITGIITSPASIKIQPINKYEQDMIDRGYHFTTSYIDRIEGVYYLEETSGIFTQVAFHKEEETKWDGKKYVYTDLGYSLWRNSHISFKDVMTVQDVNYRDRRETIGSVLNAFRDAKVKYYTLEEIKAMPLLKLHVKLQTAKIPFEKFTQ